MKNYLKAWKHILVIMLCFALAISMLPSSAIAAQDGSEEPADTGQTKYAFPTILQNPRTEADESMTSGQSVTWDYVWFGSYPQSEVESTDAVYSQLAAVEEAQWDNNNDITLDGTKYRRMKKGDATFATSGKKIYYDWPDDTTYHYFKYEPIKWRVLEVSDGKALLLADIALDDQKYNAKLKEVTWETSSIRSWLNGYSAASNISGKDYTDKSFIKCAFTQKEQEAILAENIKNEKNLSYGTEGGNDTTDKVFLLSESDVYAESSTVHGFVSDKDTMDEARRCTSSTYAKAMGICSSTAGNAWWWLRSPGIRSSNATFIDDSGCGKGYGINVDDTGNGVRPALYLNLSSLIYLSNDSADKVWKLTMNDSENKTVALDISGKLSREGTTITVPYTYTGSDVSQISIIITDKAYEEEGAQIVSYGALQGATIEYASGTGTFTLPKEYANKTCGKDYYVYIMAEDRNENTENYGSALVPVSIPDSKIDTTTTLSEHFVSAAYGDSYTITAQTKAGDVDIAGSEVAYYTDGNCTSDRTTTQPTNAGVYYARGEYAGDDTHLASNSDAIKVEIKKKQLTVAWSTKFTYDGTEKFVSASPDGILEADKDCVKVVFEDNDAFTSKATNAGKYVAKASLSGNARENYVLQGEDEEGYICSFWNIYPADVSNNVTLNVAGMNKTYDGKAADPSSIEITGYPQITTVKTEIAYYTADGKTKLDSAPTDAGRYKVKVILTDCDGNYKPVKKSGTYTIKKASASAPGKATVKATAETIKGRADGKITGINDTMEYSKDGGKTYTSVGKSMTELTNLAAGTYFIRYKETANYKASKALKVTVKAGTTTYETQLALSAKLKVLPSGNSLKASWSKVSKADGYYVYVQYCGKDFQTTPTAVLKGNTSKSVTITKINKKAIDTKKVCKLYVVAYKTVNGQNIIIGKSICAHIAGKNNTKYTNPNKVTTTKSSYSLKAGRTAKIKASQTLVNTKKKALKNSHTSQFRYASSNKSVATVNWTTGKITAVGKGTCNIYVYARNGYTKSVSVTVK